LNLAMHPQIIGRSHRIRMLEDVPQSITGRSDVRIARPESDARHYRERHGD